MSKIMNVLSGRSPVTVEQSAKLMKARCRLMTREPWYGHIAMSMIWVPSNMPWMPEYRRTMGVRIVNGGEIQCIYYPPFVEKLTIKELFAVIQHEIEHIVRVHCIRVGARDPEAWNIAADMTVNGRKNSPRIGYRESTTSEIIVPLKGQIVWIPEDWQQDGTSEAFYDKLEKQQKALEGQERGREGQGQEGRQERPRRRRRGRRERTGPERTERRARRAGPVLPDLRTGGRRQLQLRRGLREGHRRPQRLEPVRRLPRRGSPDHQGRRGSGDLEVSGTGPRPPAGGHQGTGEAGRPLARTAPPVSRQARWEPSQDVQHRGW